MSAGFPLLHLPLLPLKYVLDVMYIEDLIRLHWCSKKIHKRLDLLRLEIHNNPRGSSGCFSKNYVTITIIVDCRDRIKIQIDCEHRIVNKYQSCFPFYFCLKHIDPEAAGAKNSFKIDGITVPVVLKEENEIQTFWKDQLDGLKISVNYFKKFFNTQTIDYSIYGSNDSKFSRNLKNVVKEMAEQTISNCIIRTEIPKIDDYKFILDNIKPTICFEHLHDFSHQSYSCRLDTNFTSKYLKLELADWFTFDNLCSTNCEEIILKCTELNSGDMIKYVKLWMDGKFPKLKRLDVEVYQTVSLGSFLSELQGYEKKLRCTIDKVVDTVQIKRQNHTIATISNKPTPYSQISFEFHILENPFNN